jgi:hypothetical protein
MMVVEMTLPLTLLQCPLCRKIAHAVEKENDCMLEI